jgi:hypothetical protein
MDFLLARAARRDAAPGFEVAPIARVEERTGVMRLPDVSSRDLNAQSILLDAAGTTALLELEE